MNCGDFFDNLAIGMISGFITSITASLLFLLISKSQMQFKTMRERLNNVFTAYNLLEIKYSNPTLYEARTDIIDVGYTKALHNISNDLVDLVPWDFSGNLHKLVCDILEFSGMHYCNIDEPTKEEEVSIRNKLKCFVKMYEECEKHQKRDTALLIIRDKVFDSVVLLLIISIIFALST